MPFINNLQSNSPVIKEDLTLGILSCTININGVVKTYYFQHIQGGIIINDKLAFELKNAFNHAKVQEGHNGITTGLDSFIPSEIMDSSLIGIRQIGINYLDNGHTTMTIDHIAMNTRIPQALLYNMLDETLSEYKSSSRILRFSISSSVIDTSKIQGFHSYLGKFIETRRLKQEFVDGIEKGYTHEDTVALKLIELRKNARLFNAEAREILPVRLIPESDLTKSMETKKVENQNRKIFNFMHKMK
ncbi:MAG: hypothetical protein H7196_02575 [candidate division SR1 bacterium]|nr:hypothetical protein [candidate division SR1 bacterium]